MSAARQADGRRSAILMSTPVGEPGGEELARLARLGQVPRRDYVQLAQVLDADVLDAEFMMTRASRAGRLVTRRAGVVKGLLFEAYTQSHRYVHMVAWADRLGLPLALLNKLSGRRRDLAMLSAYASQGRKAQLLKDAKVHTHLGALMYYSGEQRRLAVERLGVPADKTFYLGNPVDERFWSPLDRPVEDTVVAVGWEARDYPTLLSAMTQAPCTVDVAVGTLGLWGSAATLSSGEQGPDSDDARRAFLEACRGTLSYPIYRAWIDSLDNGTIGSNVRVHHQLSPQELRELYARARVVVVPLHDVEFDAGVTAICEGMAMGKPVVVTRTRGQVDVLRDGEQGLYVPPADPRALREAVQHLLDNPARAEQMGRAGRALVEERHTVDAFVSRVADIIRSTPSPLVPAAARAGGA